MVTQTLKIVFGSIIPKVKWIPRFDDHYNDNSQVDLVTTTAIVK